MPNIRSLFYLLGCVALATACLADEDDMEQSWPSPNGRFVLHHTATYNHRRIPLKKTEDTYDQAAAYTLTRNGKVIWGLASPVDESAHSFRCVWAADSRSVLILDRPARGDVEMTLVRTTAPARSAVLHLQKTIDRLEARIGDNDEQHLQKAWFGAWRYAKDRFEGIVICTRSPYYRLHLTVDPTARKPRIRLLSTKIFTEWEDTLEDL